MNSVTYTTSDTLDGTVNVSLLATQVAGDPLISAELGGICQSASAFTLVFISTPSAAEQSQCNVVVAAHSGFYGFQDDLVARIKAERQLRLAKTTAEYPASSGNLFSCSTSSQDNWSKLSALDHRGLVVYPFVVTTNDERTSYAITDSTDLTHAVASISTAVLTERTRAQEYIDAVLAAGSEADAQAAAQPYMN